MNKRKAIIGGLVVAFLGIAAWAFGLFGGDPAIAKLHDLGSQMRDSNLTAAQREQLRGEFRQQIQSLTDAQRHAFFESGRGERESRATQRMNEFFAMSKADQTKRLDEIIDRMKANTAGQNAGNRNGGNRAGMTDAQREQRSKQRIENSNPNTRAQSSEFRRMLDQRVQQRGISLPPGRGGFGPRGA